MSDARLSDAHALLIGVSAYEQYSPLAKTLNDVMDLGGVLKDPSLCAYPAEQVQVVTEREATRTGILHALDQLAARTTPSSTVFLHYAGHGLHIDSGPHKGAYLVPIDGVRSHQFAQVAASLISGAELGQRLAKVPARKLLLMLDCCHAQGIGLLRGEDELAGGLRGDDGGVLRGGLSTDMLAGLAAGEGRVVLSAASLTEGAMELSADRNGLFTKHLLAGLGGAVPGADPYIRIFDLFTFTAERVQRESRNRQNPVLQAEVKDNFPIALRLGGRSATLPGAAPSPSPATAASPNAPQPDERALFDILSELTGAQFDQLIIVLGLKRGVLSPTANTPAVRLASEFLQLMKQPGRGGLSRLVQALRELEVL